MNSETVAIKPFLALLLMALVRSETVPAETKACQFDLMRRCNHKFRESFAPDAAFGKDFDQVYCNGLQVSHPGKSRRLMEAPGSPRVVELVNVSTSRRLG